MPPRRVLVTGAGGFVGRALSARLLSDSAFADARFILLDTHPLDCSDPRVEAIHGDLADAGIVDAAIGDGVDLVYHLAAVVGGAAEADYALSRRVNIDATLSLFERLRDTGRCPRVVYASSIAVFGEPPPAQVDDDTRPRPTMTYGAQKHMMEVALAHFSARGWLDGVSLRLPAIVAKPAVTGVPAVFLNRVFHAFAAQENMTMPVSPDGTCWLLSTQACVAALLNAAHLPASEIRANRTLTLPALRVTMRALVEALRKRHGDTTHVTFAPDARLEAQFASQPPLSTAAADRLGFRHDGDIATLVARAGA